MKYFELSMSTKVKYFIFQMIFFSLLFVNNNYSQTEPDPNFYIFLSFGQSNMEGQGVIESQDTLVDPRFKMMSAVNCYSLGRTKGEWYTAVPPLCRCSSGISPTDYFGRTMIENLPDSITVGVINVSVAGSKIELFDKDSYQDYVAGITEDWLINIINVYEGNPYQYLIDLAKLAQNDGIIKGILLHQGEANNGDTTWPTKVNNVYENILDDLGLDANSVPLLAGEVVHEDQGGVCAGMNSIISQLPQTISNSHIISSSGCTAKSDSLHFNSEGYRELGKRYGIKMLSILDSENQVDEPLRWVGTWSTAPYAAGTNTPPSPYLENNTLRQIIRASISGDTIRVKFSNRTSPTPVTMNSVNIAVSTDASTSIIDSSTIKQLKFNGSESVTMNAYSEVTSDPLAFNLTPGMRLAITIYYGKCQISPEMTFHYGSRTDSYILAGDQSTSIDFAGATTVERWYHLSSIDVLAPKEAGAIAVLGNSITDGYGLHNGPNNKWTDFFADKLLADSLTSQVSVLNLGIGATWLSTSGVSRFQQDILDQSGLRWIIIFYGVNDIGGGASAETIISAYRNLIAQAHAENIRIYGATITPFNGHSYYSASHEAVRKEVNNWIRTPGNFDKFIDFDKVIRDPSDTTKMQAIYSNDWLHPNAEGYQFLGESIDINLFLGADTLFEQIDTTNIESYYFEAECGTVGDSWNIFEDSQASNEKYVTVKSGVQSLNQAKTDSSSLVTIPFSIDTVGNYFIYARLNCPTYDDDSYWFSIDDQGFVMQNGLVTSGWQWVKISEGNLSMGEHVLSICYREDGAKLDKICISNSEFPPTGIGDEAENICTIVGLEDYGEPKNNFSLQQNYPNPFNPETTINYSIPIRQKISIKVYDVLGKEVLNLFEGIQNSGTHEIKFDASSISSGIYFYNLKMENQIEVKKMMVLK